MKTFFEGIINIPAGRKAGKYLQKIKKVERLSELVRSLNYCIVELETGQEWTQALESCHSCQSDHPETFIRVWKQIKGVKFLGLVDKDGKIVARCLVNPAWGTHAPTYGQLHYMLSVRLEFAGFKQGWIAGSKEVKKALEIEVAPAVSKPASKVVISYKRHEDYSAKIAALENFIKNRDKFSGAISYRICRQGRFFDISDRVEVAHAALSILRAKQAKFKKYGHRQEIKTLAPVDYKYVKETRVKTYESTLYLDSVRKFMPCKKIYRPGFYKK